MNTDVFTIKGSSEGPISIILAGVHGDEKCGVEAFQKILPTLTIKSGVVFFIYANPRAIEKDVRYTEANLNRLFRSDASLAQAVLNTYEYKRATFLRKYLDEADALLDVHASFTPDSAPFAICEKNASGIVEYLPVELTVSGFDEIEPGGTDYYMNRSGKIGICIECGYLKDSNAVGVAEESIINFLKVRGHINNDLQPRTQAHIHMYELYKTRSANFRLTKAFVDFENVKKNQVIGLDGNDEIRAKKESVILFAQNHTAVGEEAFLLGEQKKRLG